MAKHLEDTYGYFCYPSRGSRGIDLVCLNPYDYPHLMIEVGTKSKSVRLAFSKLREAALFPGSYPLVVRKTKKAGRVVLRWHATDGKHGHNSFIAALEEARSL